MSKRLLCAAALLLSLQTAARAARTLDIHFIDVEGGQATLIVTPEKESLLVDTGFPGLGGRDADRIAQAAKSAGVKRLDYLIVTHYHSDHVGGVTQLVERLPVRTFVDHGPNNESGKNADELYASYEKAVAAGKHLVVKPGDQLPLKGGVKVQFVSANGKAIDSALPGAGQPNPLCNAPEYPEDKSENAFSAGFLLTYGDFRFVNLGDLTSRREMDLVCPANKIGEVDVYLTTHHGLQTSGAKEIVHALSPRVGIMNNGARKGGSPQAYNILKQAPGVEDIWQLHFAVAGGAENNSPDSMIANLEERCEGKGLMLAANQDGSFTVTNNRNKFSKSYGATK